MATPPSKVKPVRAACTLTIVGFAILLWHAPGFSNAFVYDRAAILSGQIWRLWTGHLVHFSASHLVYNVIVFAVLGWMAEMQVPRFGRMCAIAAAVVGLGLLFERGMAFYGGLSGVVTAVAVFLALTQLCCDKEPKWFAIALLGGVAAKIMGERVASQALFATLPEADTVVSPTAHLLGAAAGALVGWFNLKNRSCIGRERSQRTQKENLA